MLEVSISDDIRDLVRDGFDVALRTGKPQDSPLIGRGIGYCPRYLLAAPDYLARHPAIVHPRQLVEHRCITHLAWPAWLLQRGGED